MNRKRKEIDQNLLGKKIPVRLFALVGHLNTAYDLSADSVSSCQINTLYLRILCISQINTTQPIANKTTFLFRPF